jgi:hypothetical protein
MTLALWFSVSNPHFTFRYAENYPVSGAAS